MDYRDYLTQEQLDAIYAQEKQKDEQATLASVGELALSLLSGALAEPTSGIAGILSAIAGGDASQNANAVRKVQEGMTYQPRNPYALNKLVEALAPVAEAIEGGSRYLGDKTLEYTGSPALATAAYTLPMGVAEVIDSTPLLYSARKLPKRGLLGADIGIEDIDGQTRMGRRERGVWGAGGAEGAPHEQMLRAQQLLDKGYTPRQVWDETAKTGTPIYVDAQGNLTYPIPATNLKTRTDSPSAVHDLTYLSSETIGDYFDYPELYAAYPRARDIELRGAGPDASYRGVFYENQGFNGEGRIDLQTHTRDAQGNLVPVPLETIESVLEHELTHAVQGWEDLPRGANRSIGASVARKSDSAQENAYGLLDRLDVEAQNVMQASDVGQKTALMNTSRRLDTIKQLEGYLRDYYNGGKLTDKRRHILNAGWLMDHNDEFRMRMDLPWAKKHRPQAERDAVYATYIENVLEDARNHLDPELVAQVEAAGVKNPTKKFERQVDNVNKQLKPIHERQREIQELASTGLEPSRVPPNYVHEGKDGKWYAAGVYDDNYVAKPFSSEASAKRAYLEQVKARENYLNAEGEVNARIMQEYLELSKHAGDDAYKKNPFTTQQAQQFPVRDRIVLDEYGNLDPVIHEWLMLNDPYFRDNLLDVKAPSPIKRKSR